MEKVGDRYGKMERYCSTGQSPQRAVAPKEEDEEEEEEEEEEAEERVTELQTGTALQQQLFTCHLKTPLVARITQ